MESTGNAQFWSALSQVAAVLALTLVIEARVVRRTWHRDTPRWVKIPQACIFIASGGAVILVLYVSLAELNQPGALGILSADWATVITMSAVGLVILSPLVATFYPGVDGSD